MGKQVEMIKKLTKLMEERPELEVKVFVDHEVCGGDDFRYWLGSIESVEITPYFNHNDEKFFTDEEEIREFFQEEVNEAFDDININGREPWNKERVEEEVEERYNKEVIEIICIRIGLPG